MGAQEHKTKVIQNSLNPKWNASMQFTIKDLQEDVLCITVYDRDLFSPNGMCWCNIGSICDCVLGKVNIVVYINVHWYVHRDILATRLIVSRQTKRD